LATTLWLAVAQMDKWELGAHVITLPCSLNALEHGQPHFGEPLCLVAMQMDKWELDAHVITLPSSLKAGDVIEVRRVWGFMGGKIEVQA